MVFGFWSSLYLSDLLISGPFAVRTQAIDDIREYNRGDQVFINVYIDDMRAPFFPKVGTSACQKADGNVGQNARFT